MSVMERKDIFEIHPVNEDSDFRRYLDSSPSGFKIVSSEYLGCGERILYSATGDFEKWLKKNKPEINVEVEKADRKLVLQSGDYWLPLVFLAGDVTLPIYLNIVANYLYEKIKGRVKGRKTESTFQCSMSRHCRRCYKES